MPINPRALSRVIGKSTSDVLIGTKPSRNHHCCPLHPSSSAAKQSNAANSKSLSSSGLGFRSRALERLRQARGSAIAIGAPVMNVV
eukprot:6277878-Prymnesium_polylepis.1